MPLTVETFNQLSFGELCRMEGIGAGTARRIRQRSSNRPFVNTEGLLAIKGLGKGKLEKYGIKIEPKRRKRFFVSVGESRIPIDDGSFALNSFGLIDWWWRIPRESRKYIVSPADGQRLKNNSEELNENILVWGLNITEDEINGFVGDLEWATTTDKEDGI